MRTNMVTWCLLSPRRFACCLIICLSFTFVLYYSNIINISCNVLQCKDIRQENHESKVPSCSSTTVHLSFMVGGANSARQLIAAIKSIIYYMNPGFKCSKNETTNPQMQFTDSVKQEDAILTLHFIVDQAAHISLQPLFQSWQLPGVLYYFYDFEPFKKNVTWIPTSHYSGQFGSGKLLIADILPLNLSKVISLDVDMLLNADIRELWGYFDQFATKQMIGMTSNQSPWYRSISSWPIILNGLGFNTGLILLDLDKMRKVGWTQLWTTITRNQLKKLKDIALPDQDIINAVLIQYPDYAFSVPCNWNVQLNNWKRPLECQLQSSTDTMTDTRKENISIQQLVLNVKIAHFNSPTKPEDLTPGQISSVESKEMSEEKRYLRQWFHKRYHNFHEYDGRWIKEKLTFLDPRNLLNKNFQFFNDPSNCSEFEANRLIMRRIHPFYLTYDFSGETNEKLTNDVTLVSQLSFDRIECLELLLSNWPGPVSLALYLSDYEAHKLAIFVKQSKVLSRRKNIGFHVVFTEGTFYPINELRNVALTYARTNAVFHLDIDFIPSPNLHLTIEKILKEKQYIKGNKAETNIKDSGDANECYIVPAFETFDVRFTIPSTKKDLLDKLDQNIVVPFQHKIWTHGHLATNYTRWRSETKLYQVQWSADYEPFVVTNRRSPAFDTTFVDFGWNMASYIMALDALGYKFFVLPDAFVLHLPHSQGMELMQHQYNTRYKYCVDKMKHDFIKQLVIKHGVQAQKYLEIIQKGSS